MGWETLSIAALTIAIAAVWARPTHLWIPPFALFVLAGLIGGSLTGAALVPGALYGAVVRCFVCASTRRSRVLTGVPLIVGALVLSTHLAPGFERVRVLQDLSIAGRPDWNGVGFTADKPLVGLYLALAFRDRLCADLAELGRALRRVAPPALAGIVGIYAAGIALGHVAFDPVPVTPSLLPAMLLLLVRNLFFTVVTEEMLFRQIVQSGLESLYRGERSRRYALLSASALFGAAHLPGGWQLGLLATLAGALYGYVYLVSGRVEAAMLAHVALNGGYALLLAAPGV